MRRLAALLAIVALPSGAQADDLCFGLGLTEAVDAHPPELRLVARDAPKRLRFVNGGDASPDCPNGTEACRRSAFVTPGDPVVVVGGARGFACATFTGPAPKMASTTGFLPAETLAASPSSEAPDWIGAWRSGDEQRIAITRAPAGKLAIAGDASWGAADPARVARGGVNTGTFEAEAEPRGASLSFAIGADRTIAFDAPEAKDACRIRLWRLGPYLAAADYGGCGGMNVTFSGVYRRD